MAVEQEGGGTLVRGADGELYYIPDAQLEAFRLPEEKAESARKLIGDGGALTLSVLRGPAVPRAGLAISNTETVSVVSIAAIRQTR